MELQYPWEEYHYPDAAGSDVLHGHERKTSGPAQDNRPLRLYVLRVERLNYPLTGYERTQGCDDMVTHACSLV